MCGALGVFAIAVAAGPCDIFAAGGTPCVAAHSTVRALYAAYNGSLYRVNRTSDYTTLHIKVRRLRVFPKASCPVLPSLVPCHARPRTPPYVASCPVMQSAVSRRSKVLVAGGFADSAAQDTFCAGTDCTIDTIYDQSPQGNHLTTAPGGPVTCELTVCRRTVYSGCTVLSPCCD